MPAAPLQAAPELCFRRLSSLFTFYFFPCRPFIPHGFNSRCQIYIETFFVATDPSTVSLIPSGGIYMNDPTGISNSRCSTELIILLPKPSPLPTFYSFTMYLFCPHLKLETSIILTHLCLRSPATESNSTPEQRKLKHELGPLCSRHSPQPAARHCTALHTISCRAEVPLDFGPMVINHVAMEKFIIWPFC